MPSSTGTVALICFLYPSSKDKQSMVTSHLQSASKDYYCQPSSLCTTWSYFTLSNRKGGLYQPLSTSFPAKSENPKLLVGGVEIYTDKSALSTQMEKPWFKEFARKAKDESWYQEGKGEEMRVWEPVGGFVSRKAREDGGKGMIVMLAVFECKDSEKAVESTAKNLSDFAAWVKEHEPGTLTYSVMVRPAKKGSNEVIMFERYDGAASLGKHGSSREFKAMFKSILPYIEPKKTKICEWEEVDTSFVGESLPKETKL